MTRPGLFFAGYSGASMYPTLAPADLLEIRHYENRDVQIGDVVVFQPPGENDLIVHRVAGIDAGGIRTRGDNNCREDDWRLELENIQGQVVAAWRGRKGRTIVGGKFGQVYAHFMRRRIVSAKRLSCFFHLLYPILVPMRIIASILHCVSAR